MFDIGAIELLIVVVVAVLVIGPKDMPLAMRTAGRWIGKMRRMSGHFRAGVDAMVREAELEDMEAEWKRRNAEIMARNPAVAQQDADAEAAMGPMNVPLPKEGKAEPSSGTADGAADADATQSTDRGTPRGTGA